MEFKIDEKKDYVILKQGAQSCICIYKYNIPDDFDPERTARTIERMEKIIKGIEQLRKTPLEHSTEWHDIMLMLVTNLYYIEHGKPKEKVVRFALIANTENFVIETKDVPISEAKKLGFNTDDI